MIQNLKNPPIGIGSRSCHRISGSTVVVKYGGAAMVDSDLRAACLQDVARLHRQGTRVVLVHGGGPEVSQDMRRQGLEPRFVGGLRVTDEAALVVTQRVLVGSTNRALVAGLQALGIPAVGFCAGDGGTVRVTGKSADLGLVGEVSAVNPDLLQTLLGSGFVPVVAPLGADAEGQAYNVNADTIASAVAAALNASRLILLTDVDGIRTNPDDPETALQDCTGQDLWRLKADGAVQGGMIPKVEAILQTLSAGVQTVQVLDGRRPHALRDALVPGRAPGTTVTNPQEALCQIA